MSFEKRCHHGCHHVQKCSFQPIAKSNPVNDLNYSVSQLKALVNQLTQSLAALTPSYASFYNVTTTPGPGQVLLAYPANISPVNFSNASPTNTNDISITGNTITVNTTGVYQIDYSLLVLTSDTSGDGTYWARFGLRVVSPNSTATLPVQSFQSHNLSVTTTIPDATGTVTVAQCIPLAASFQLQLTAGSTIQLINLSPTNITLCNGVGTTPSLNGVNARINFERLSPIAS